MRIVLYWLAMLALWLVGVTLVLGTCAAYVYVLVKVVKWAWYA